MLKFECTYGHQESYASFSGTENKIFLMTNSVDLVIFSRHYIGNVVTGLAL